MAESFCRVGDIEICFETFGDPADPAVLLVMGLGTQMLGWHEDFCTDLAGRGFHVIRYDNRDIGRSTILSSAPVPSLGQILRRDKRAAVVHAWPRWPPTASACSTTSRSSAPTSSASRWAA